MKNERGFTLIEVLASMTILFIILISFLSIFAQSAMFTRTNENSLQATNLADRVMEVLRADGRADEEHLRATLLSTRFINEGCRVDELTSIGCQSDASLSIKIEILDAKGELGLVPVRIDIIHDERETAIATRHFYANDTGGSVD